MLAALASCSGDPATPPSYAEPLPDARGACRSLVAALPAEVADQQLVDRSTSRDALGAAWGEPAIVLSCGVPRPRGWNRTAACTTVDGVDWFAPDEQLLAEGDTTFTVVNRVHHVEVRLPAEYWPPAAALADLSSTVAGELRATDRCV